jgi:hypothetical protein
MGDQHHPKHFTEAAKAYAVEAARAEIGTFAQHCLGPIREAARKHGYAVTEHGSKARDYDLVAVPWTDEAGSAEEVIAAIAGAIRSQTGWGTVNGAHAEKPHGRVAVIIIGSFGVTVDLSVTARN